jgi:Holliday junction resolvase-like predicted endonuclease
MRILGRNLRFGSLELDIVASEASPRGPTLVVVEVRSRSESAYGTALSGLNGRKQRYLLRAAAALLSSGRFADYERIRIDVCIVHIPPGVTESSGAVEVVGAVEHFPGAIVR